MRKYHGQLLYLHETETTAYDGHRPQVTIIWEDSIRQALPPSPLQ